MDQVKQNAEILALVKARTMPMREIVARYHQRSADRNCIRAPLCDQLLGTAAYARMTGKPCQASGIGRRGRCRLHGGESTGPRTEGWQGPVSGRPARRNASLLD